MSAGAVNVSVIVVPSDPRPDIVLRTRLELPIRMLSFEKSTPSTCPEKLYHPGVPDAYPAPLPLKKFVASYKMFSDPSGYRVLSDVVNTN